VDAIVVGAGIMGSATAWWLARRGRDTTMLEQFGPGHTRGSSHGGSRIYRLAYPDSVYIDLARAAREDWRELEAETGAELLVKTGSLDHGDPVAVREIESALQTRHVRHEMLDALDAATRWPGMRFDGPVLHQPDGGRVVADRAWQVLTERFVELGGTLRWETPARAIEVVGDRARVVTDDETYDAAVVVVAAGGWLEPVLGAHLALPKLVVSQESAFHFAPRDEQQTWPSFIHHGPIAQYGLEAPGEGVKVAEHHSGPPVTAATRDGQVDPAARARVVEFVERWLPGLVPEPVSEVTCLYTNTATEDFVLDRVGPIVVVSPCSGHGFKFAPAIGRMASNLAAGGAPVGRFALPG
jgi:monomeric sarcosine oxidase